MIHTLTSQLDIISLHFSREGPPEICCFFPGGSVVPRLVQLKRQARSGLEVILEAMLKNQLLPRCLQAGSVDGWREAFARLAHLAIWIGPRMEDKPWITFNYASSCSWWSAMRLGDTKFFCGSCSCDVHIAPLATRGFEYANISNDALWWSFPRPLLRPFRSFSNTHGAVYSTTAWSSWWSRPNGSMIGSSWNMDHIWEESSPEAGASPLELVPSGKPDWPSKPIRLHRKCVCQKMTWSNQKIRTSHQNDFVCKWGTSKKITKKSVMLTYVDIICRSKNVPWNDPIERYAPRLRQFTELTRCWPISRCCQVATLWGNTWRSSSWQRSGWELMTDHHKMGLGGKSIQNSFQNSRIFPEIGEKKSECFCLVIALCCIRLSSSGVSGRRMIVTDSGPILFFSWCSNTKQAGWRSWITQKKNKEIHRYSEYDTESKWARNHVERSDENLPS